MGNNRSFATVKQIYCTTPVFRKYATLIRTDYRGYGDEDDTGLFATLLFDVVMKCFSDFTPSILKIIKSYLFVGPIVYQAMELLRLLMKEKKAGSRNSHPPGDLGSDMFTAFKKSLKDPEKQSLLFFWIEIQEFRKMIISRLQNIVEKSERAGKKHIRRSSAPLEQIFSGSLNPRSLSEGRASYSRNERVQKTKFRGSQSEDFTRDRQFKELRIEMKEFQTQESHVEDLDIGSKATGVKRMFQKIRTMHRRSLTHNFIATNNRESANQNASQLSKDRRRKVHDFRSTRHSQARGSQTLSPNNRTIAHIPLKKSKTHSPNIIKISNKTQLSHQCDFKNDLQQSHHDKMLELDWVLQERSSKIQVEKTKPHFRLGKVMRKSFRQRKTRYSQRESHKEMVSRYNSSRRKSGSNSYKGSRKSRPSRRSRSSSHGGSFAGSRAGSCAEGMAGTRVHEMIARDKFDILFGLIGKENNEIILENLQKNAWGHNLLGPAQRIYGAYLIDDAIYQIAVSESVVSKLRYTLVMHRPDVLAKFRHSTFNAKPCSMLGCSLFDFIILEKSNVFDDSSFDGFDEKSIKLDRPKSISKGSRIQRDSHDKESDGRFILKTLFDDIQETVFERLLTEYVEFTKSQNQYLDNIQSIYLNEPNSAPV